MYIYQKYLLINYIIKEFLFFDLSTLRSSLSIKARVLLFLTNEERGEKLSSRHVMSILNCDKIYFLK